MYISIWREPYRSVYAVGFIFRRLPACPPDDGTQCTVNFVAIADTMAVHARNGRSAVLHCIMTLPALCRVQPPNLSSFLIQWSEQASEPAALHVDDPSAGIPLCSAGALVGAAGSNSSGENPHAQAALLHPATTFFSICVRLFDRLEWHHQKHTADRDSKYSMLRAWEEAHTPAVVPLPPKQSREKA